MFRNTTPPRPAGTRQEPRRNRVNAIEREAECRKRFDTISSRILDLVMV